MIKSLLTSFFAILPLLFPCLSMGEILTKDTTWSGKISLAEDVVVPRGIRLTITPGTVVTVSPAESTKTDPEYLSPLTEITVRGEIVIRATDTAPVTFVLDGEAKPDGWAGIMIDGGSAEINSTRISSAETAVSVLAGHVRLQKVTLNGNRYGLVAQGKDADVAVAGSKISGNDYGFFSFDNPHVKVDDTIISGNRKKDRFDGAIRELVTERSFTPPAAHLASRRYGNDVLLGETVWQGKIEIDGIVRVPERSRLVILPGTVVEFRKKTSSQSGMGESGILIQGRILAKGTPLQPIFFRSAEKERKPGDWDAINIMNSDGTQNLLEYCQIEDAYRGLHFHFSNVAVNESVIRNNYRGIQFQESAVEIRGNSLYGNRSGIQGRDSEIVFVDNVIAGNYIGANFYHATISSTRNIITGNIREGMRIRESVPRVDGNVIGGNRFGLMVADCFYGSFSRNVIAGNTETGFSLKNADNLDISGNFVSANGLNGINLQDVRAFVTGNQIADNGERGLGIIAFDGRITANNFAGNGLYAIDLEGRSDINAQGNWWGGSQIDAVILDKKDDAARGLVRYEKPAADPLQFSWPDLPVRGKILWRGNIAVGAQVKVPTGSELSIAPGTHVAFSDGGGIYVAGRLIASGEKGREIVFESLEKKEPSSWDEIILEHADGSRFAHCTFENATWGIHSHFTNLSVSDCHFTNNYGGMRFRSGPITITGCRFDGNSIGIRSFRGNATINGNEISGNETGIFVREKGSGLTIHGNNIFGNSNYNLRVGDFNDEDISAENNWWGAADPLPTIFDARQEPGIGYVRVHPFSEKPLELRGRVAP